MTFAGHLDSPVLLILIIAPVVLTCLASAAGSVTTALPEPIESLAVELAAAEEGDAAAMLKVARRYHDGDDAAVDLLEAIHWYRKAAEAGDARRCRRWLVFTVTVMACRGIMPWQWSGISKRRNWVIRAR